MKRKLSKLLCLLLMIIMVVSAVPITALAAASSSPIRVMLLDKNHNVIKTLNRGSTYKTRTYDYNTGKAQGEISLKYTDGKYFLSLDDGNSKSDYGYVVFSNIASIVIDITDTSKGNDVVIETTTSLHLNSYGDDIYDGIAAIHAPGINLTIRGLNTHDYRPSININQYTHRSTDYYSLPVAIYAETVNIDGIDTHINNLVNPAADPSGQARLTAFGIRAHKGISINDSRVDISFDCDSSDNGSWKIVSKDGTPNYTPDSHFYGLHTQGGKIELKNNSRFIFGSSTNSHIDSCMYTTALKDEYVDAYKDSIFYYGIYNEADPETFKDAKKEELKYTNGQVILKDSSYDMGLSPVNCGYLYASVSTQAIYTGGTVVSKDSSFSTEPAVIFDNASFNNNAAYARPVTRGIEDCSEVSDNPGVVIKNNSIVNLNVIDQTTAYFENVKDTDFTKTFGILSRHRGVLIQDSKLNIMAGLPIGDAALDEKSSGDAVYGLQIKDSNVKLSALGSSVFNFKSKSGVSKSRIDLTNGEVILETTEDSSTVSTTPFTISPYSTVTEGSYNSSTMLAEGVENVHNIFKRPSTLIDTTDCQFKTKKSFTVKAISNTKLTGSVTYSADEARVGVSITAVADTNASSSSMLSYQWQIYNTRTKMFIDIPDATDATFTPTDNLEGALIRVTVSSPYYSAGTVNGKSFIVQEATKLQGKIDYKTIDASETDSSKYIIASFLTSQSISGLSYQWQASIDNGRTWLDVPTLTDNYVKLTPSGSENKELMLRVVVTAENHTGSVRGAAITIKPPAEFKLPFTDVKAKNWFYNDVLFVYKNGLMNGVTKTLFEPNTTTTRGMFVTVLYRLEGSPEVTNDNAFKDVKTGFYYDNPIRWATANGIVGGYGNGKFGPEDEITREQMATILYRYYAYKGEDVSELADISSYKDANKIPSYAVTPFKWAVNRGIIKGMTDTTLEPLEKATRAQIAAILNRISKVSVTTEKVLISKK